MSINKHKEIIQAFTIRSTKEGLKVYLSEMRSWHLNRNECSCKTMEKIYNNQVIKAKFLMQNHQINSIHSQSFVYSHPNFPTVASLPSAQNYSLFNFISSLQFKCQSLSMEYYSLKNTLQQLQKQISQIKQLTQQQQQVPFVLIKEKSGKIRKEFTKHLNCPFSQCRNRYSSKISLRAHIRREHKRVSICPK